MGAGQYISITLCWDRQVEHTGGSTYHYGDTFFPYADDYGPMNDLDLYLMTTDGVVVASSVSNAVNVEHIFIPLPSAGNYKIVVSHALFGLGTTEYYYGLAWWYGNAPSPLSGDYNSDGSVNAADYVLWRNDPASYGGDPDGYNTWRANFGNTAGSGSSFAAVPEPAFAALVLLGGAWIPLMTRRRRWRV